MPLCSMVPCSTHWMASTVIVERNEKAELAAEKKYSSSHKGPYAAPGVVVPSPRRSTRRPVPLVTNAGGRSVAVGEGDLVGEGVGEGEPVRVGVWLRVTVGVPVSEGVTLGVPVREGVTLGVPVREGVTLVAAIHSIVT